MTIGNWEVTDKCIQGLGDLSKCVISKSEFVATQKNNLKKSILDISSRDYINDEQIDEFNIACIYALGYYKTQIPDIDWFSDLYIKQNEDFNLEMDTLFTEE